MKKFWNQRYAAKEYAYGKLPNVFFKRFIDTHSPGNILLPADGEGRNAVYAAEKGWKVDAFDRSENAQEKALQLAKDQDVNINFEVASIETYSYKEDYYDAVGLFYVHLPKEIKDHLNKNITKALTKDGKIVLEYFSKEQIRKLSGGPKKEAMLASIEQMKESFASLDMLWLTKEQIILEEGLYHVGEASVIRMIAKK